MLLSWLCLGIIFCQTTSPSSGHTSSLLHHKILQEQQSSSFDTDPDDYANREDINEHLSEDDSFHMMHDYFVSYLPSCPNAYKISIENSYNNNNNGTGGALDGNFNSLRSGEYSLCRVRGKARLRECQGHERTSCDNPIPTGDFWITILATFRQTYYQNNNNNNVESGVKVPSWKNMEPSCQPTKCSTEQFMALNMKNPVDCSSFYICIMGHHFLLQCPVGHLFSEEYGVCVEKMYSNCGIDSLCS